MTFKSLKAKYNEKIYLGGSFFIFNQVFVVIVVIVLSYLLYLKFNPNAAGISCVYKSTLGKECPTCGFTRSFIDYLSFDYDAGIKRNSASFFYFLFCTYFALSRLGWVIFTLFFQKKANDTYLIKWDIFILVFMFLGVNFYIFLV